MIKRPLRLRDFLDTSNAPSHTNLPWVHTTIAANLLDIMADGCLTPVPCNVFKGENLCYLFAGRPAYKFSSEGEASHWQLPVVFVIRFDREPNFKRIYPFDSGAFNRKMLPDYITLFDRERFRIDNDPGNVGKVISVFFENDTRYLKRRPASRDTLGKVHNFEPRHQEIEALIRLYGEHSAAAFDDRAATIEAQLDHAINFADHNLLGIVMPEEYARDEDFIAEVKKVARRVRTYDVFPLNVNCYFGQIYSEVNRIYKDEGLLR
ncbi:MAG: hypothetical protein AB1508_12650 [Pseudomonadota bacterium]